MRSWSDRDKKIIAQAAYRFEQALVDGHRDRFVSSVAWLNVIQYVEKCFEYLKQQNVYEKNRFHLYIDRTFPIHEPSNFIQIHATSARVGREWNYDKSGKKIIKTLVENHAALVISQHLNGSVLILLYPYKSDRFKVNEEHLLFKSYKSAVDISERDIEKAVAAFLRYSQATSSRTRKSLSDHLFRWRYKLNDWREKLKLFGKAKDLLTFIKP